MPALHLIQHSHKLPCVHQIETHLGVACPSCVKIALHELSYTLTQPF